MGQAAPQAPQIMNYNNPQAGRRAGNPQAARSGATNPQAGRRQAVRRNPGGQGSQAKRPDTNAARAAKQQATRPDTSAARAAKQAQEQARRGAAEASAQRQAAAVRDARIKNERRMLNGVNHVNDQRSRPDQRIARQPAPPAEKVPNPTTEAESKRQEARERAARIAAIKLNDQDQARRDAKARAAARYQQGYVSREVRTTEAPRPAPRPAIPRPVAPPAPPRPAPPRPPKPPINAATVTPASAPTTPPAEPRRQATPPRMPAPTVVEPGRVENSQATPAPASGADKLSLEIMAGVDTSVDWVGRGVVGRPVPAARPAVPVVADVPATISQVSTVVAGRPAAKPAGLATSDQSDRADQIQEEVATGSLNGTYAILGLVVAGFLFTGWGRRRG